MTKESRLPNYRGLLTGLVSLSLAVAFIVVFPGRFATEAGNRNDEPEKGLLVRTESHTPELKNYDIRTDKTKPAGRLLADFRQKTGKPAAFAAAARENLADGEADLRSRVPLLKVEYNRDLGIPEIITPDPQKKRIERLAAPSGAGNEATLRRFISRNNALVGLETEQIDRLETAADYTNPAGNMSFVHLRQTIGGIPVFRGEVKAGFTKSGEIIRVINNLAPGLDYGSLTDTDFGDPAAAVRAAYGHINAEIPEKELIRNEAVSDGQKTVFGRGDSATTAEKIYFPTEPGTARPAWRVLIWQPVSAFYVIVDAQTGRMLWRKNLTEDQTQSATYSVYTNPQAMVNVARSPFPWIPGPTNPMISPAATDIGRTSITRIGNEPPYTFNNKGWITDGANGGNGWTDGNNVEAGLDLADPDGIDAPTAGVNRVFDFTYAPYNPNDGTGENPTAADHRSGAVTQLFYICNWFHDETYRLGFTEAALNFQDDNFGRGGTGGDRVRCEAQDSSGINNANFSAPADGSRGRMQMFRWTLTSPNLDGSLDADIVIHEFTHGLSNRLHGNSAGLSENMARMMGEGWSDYYAHALLSAPTDPTKGIYTLSGWATSNLLGGLSSYYYGIRRFPKAPLSFKGGPNNRPHNPITFADIDQTTVDYSDAAFPAPSAGHLSNTADQVHSGGEVWSAALWEVRNRMISRLGWAEGNRRALQIVTDGMKLDPLNPDYIQARDAIITAASAHPSAAEAEADVSDVREGFRIRGMGFSASVETAGGGGGTARVTEAFDFPNVRFADPFSVSDAPGDGDGFPEPGENVLLSVPVENTTGTTITNVSVNIDGGPDTPYGDIGDGQTVTKQISYTIPKKKTCGSFHTVKINVVSDVGAQTPVEQTFRLGEPAGGQPINFENTQLIDVPAGGTAGPASAYPSTISTANLSGNKTLKLELTGVAHSWVDDLDVILESPSGQSYLLMGDTFGDTVPIATTITFSDDGPDGPAPNTGGIFAGDYQPANYTPDDLFPAPAPNPTGDAANGDTFRTTLGTDAATMNGDWKLWIHDDAGEDTGTIDGWRLTFIPDDYICSLPAPGRGRADFDGDGRTDISVFRPGEGNWYINASTEGFLAVNWGTAGDIPVPGDYDGDDRADQAVFRATDAAGVPDFYILNSNGFTLSGAEWGSPGDIPVIGDYDGDGRADLAVFRPGETVWYILNSGGGSAVIGFGAAGFVPLTGDFDGDGRADPTVFGDGVWTSLLSGGGTEIVTAGAAGDLPVHGDYDGDGQTDQAAFRPGEGNWFIRLSAAGAEQTVPFGTSGDIPVPGDYDGDGRDDPAVYRNGTWWIANSQTGAATAAAFGLATDMPIPARANP